MIATHIINATTARPRLKCKCGSSITIQLHKDRDIRRSVYQCADCEEVWHGIANTKSQPAVYRLVTALNDLLRDAPGDGYEVQFEIEVLR